VGRNDSNIVAIRQVVVTAAGELVTKLVTVRSELW